MSAETSLPDDEVVNLLNVPVELARYLTTAINYVRRQGLSPAAVKLVVDGALQPATYIDVTTKLPVPELADKGINDMRERMAN